MGGSALGGMATATGGTVDSKSDPYVGPMSPNDAVSGGVTPRPMAPDIGRMSAATAPIMPQGGGMGSSMGEIGSNILGLVGSGLTKMPAGSTSSGKGGTSNVTPQSAPSSPQPGSYAPLSPQGGFNVNQASAGALQQAMQGTQQGLGFRPGMVTPVGYNPAQQRAQQLATTNISQYESPYQQAVIDRTVRDLSGAQEKALNQLGAQASAAGAFGGSRQGIAEAETRKGYAEQLADTVSGLRQSGFQQAQQAAQFDVGQRAATEAANIAAQTAARQYGAGQISSAQQQNIANQFAANQARLGAASQMGQLGQQAFGTGQAIQQQQMQQGLMQQGLQQALIDAARGQFAGYAGAPNAALQAPLAALGVTPVPETKTTTKTPGLFDYLSLGASAIASDQRLKTNVKLLGNQSGHNVYSWDWNDEGKRIADPAQPTVGVMAQELQETHPHLVQRGDDGYLRVNYNGLAAEVA